MALVFLVEDGTGVANATSYCTVEFADDYSSMNPTTVLEWEALTQTQKEHQLMWATHVLDNIVRWEGAKVSSANELSWPRQGVFDKEENLVESDVIPTAVQQAIAFLAVNLLSSDVTAIDTTRPFKKIQVDVIELTWRDGEYTELVAPYLGNLLYGLGILATPGQLGFKPIVKG